MADRNAKVQFQSLLSLAWSTINLLNTLGNILFILKSLPEQHASSFTFKEAKKLLVEKIEVQGNTTS